MKIADGIWECKYRVKVLDRAGNETGEYRTGKPATKTVDDPNLYPDAEVARLSAEAAERVVFALGKKQADVVVEGKIFRVYRDDSGRVTNAFLNGLS